MEELLLEAEILLLNLSGKLIFMRCALFAFNACPLVQIGAIKPGITSALLNYSNESICV